MYLVDTNIWLERFPDQERSAEVGRFLSEVAAEALCITDFSLHSIGIILSRLGQSEVFLRFIGDLFVEGGVTLLSVQPQAMPQVVATMGQFGLDFDDAYQYVAAGQAGAAIISFDEHFERTPRRRQTPAGVLAER